MTIFLVFSWRYGSFHWELNSFFVQILRMRINYTLLKINNGGWILNPSYFHSKKICAQTRKNLTLNINYDLYQSNQSFNITPPPPRHTPGIWHLCRPGEEEIWLSESSRGWGIWSPCVRGGEFELHPRFHVKSLAWWAIIGDEVLEDFRGKYCPFVANWLQGKGLNKLCAIFEGI